MTGCGSDPLPNCCLHHDSKLAPFVWLLPLYVLLCNTCFSSAILFLTYISCLTNRSTYLFSLVESQAHSQKLISTLALLILEKKDLPETHLPTYFLLNSFHRLWIQTCSTAIPLAAQLCQLSSKDSKQKLTVQLLLPFHCWSLLIASLPLRRLSLVISVEVSSCSINLLLVHYSVQFVNKSFKPFYSRLSLLLQSGNCETMIAQSLSYC